MFAFVHYAGATAILPMFMFYCYIHFGKSLLKCVSSLFGGWVLGIIAYRTKSMM